MQIVLYGHDALCPTLQGFAAHDPAATEEIEPAATLKAWSQDVHDRFADPGCRRSGRLPFWTQEFPATDQAEMALHVNRDWS